MDFSSRQNQCLQTAPSQKGAVILYLLLVTLKVPILWYKAPPNLSTAFPRNVELEIATSEDAIDRTAASPVAVFPDIDIAPSIKCNLMAAVM